MKSLFESVELAPRDPILGLNEQYNADTRPGKVNLGVGVYYDDEGRIPLLDAVSKAETARIEANAPRGSLLIEGISVHNKGAQTLLPGHGSTLIAAGRVLTAQPLRGTGALTTAAPFLRHRCPENRRRFPSAAFSQFQGGHQQPQLGKPPGPVRTRRLHSRNLPLLRRRHPWSGFRRYAVRLAGTDRADHRGSARLLPQPHRRGPQLRAMAANCRSRESSQP